MNPKIQQTIDTLSSRVAGARASMAKLAAEGATAQRFAAMQEAAKAAGEALLEVSKAGTGPEAMAVVDKAVAAVAAFEEAVGGLTITPAEEKLGRKVATAYGTVTLSANQLRECERYGVKPEVVAERKAKEAAARKPRVA